MAVARSWTMPQADCCCYISEASAVVPKQRVRAIAEGEKQIEVAVAVEIDPNRLANGARVESHSCHRRDVGEAATIIAIQLDQRFAAGRKTHQQVRITVTVVVAPCDRACRARLGDSRHCSDIDQRACIVAIEPSRCAIEASNRSRSPSLS